MTVSEAAAAGAKTFLVNGLITTGGIAVVLYVGGVRVLTGAIPLGTLLVFLIYVRRMQAASGGLFKVYTKLKAAEASVDRILEVMDSKELVRDARRIDPALRPWIVVGGSHAVYEPFKVFSADPDDPAGPDVVVTGEEFVLLSLLEAVLSVRGENEPMRSAFARVRDSGALDEIPTWVNVWYIWLRYVVPIGVLGALASGWL